MISKTLGALAIEDTMKKEEKAECNIFKGNKPRSRKSSEKENDGKTMNFGIAPWKMETAKAMAILGMNF